MNNDKPEGLSFAENECVNMLCNQSLNQLNFTFDQLNGSEFQEIGYFVLPSGTAFAYPIKIDFLREAILNEMYFREENS